MAVGTKGIYLVSGLITHEWIEKRGGSETVLDAMVQTFPDSEIFCLWNNAPDRFGSTKIRESWLSRSALRGKKAAALPFMPATWRHTVARDPGYDWVLASSHLFSHHVQTHPDVPKFSYVYTPARYIWTPELDKRGGHLAARLGAPLFKPLDRKRAHEAFAVAAISTFVKERIENTWNREASVIYPPVNVVSIQAVANWADELQGDEADWYTNLPEVFLLGASRFVEYKALDLVISAGELIDTPVVLVGSGPDEARLRDLAARASVPVIFRSDPSDSLLYALYQKALAYIFPPIEDFGIMPVEAMALGTPVIASAIGGAAETVADGVTGRLVDVNSQQSWSSALEGLTSYDGAEIARHARTFDLARFTSEIASWVHNGVDSWSHR